MTPTPVKSGGASFHHGAALHGSHANTSGRWRRAVAFHYVAEGVTFVDPAWTFEEKFVERISRSGDR